MTTTAQQNDPIPDHANGQKTAVTTSATVLTTGSSCVFAWLGTDAAIVVNFDGNAAVDDGTGMYFSAGFAGIVPVNPTVAIKALSLSGTANVRMLALKNRP